MIQRAFDFEALPLVVFRVRPDDSIEARWPGQDLCAVFRDWAWALDRVFGCLNPLLYPLRPVQVRVRR